MSWTNITPRDQKIFQIYNNLSTLEKEKLRGGGMMEKVLSKFKKKENITAICKNCRWIWLGCGVPPHYCSLKGQYGIKENSTCGCFCKKEVTEADIDRNITNVKEARALDMPLSVLDGQILKKFASKKRW